MIKSVVFLSGLLAFSQLGLAQVLDAPLASVEDHDLTMPRDFAVRVRTITVHQSGRVTENDKYFNGETVTCELPNMDSRFVPIFRALIAQITVTELEPEKRIVADGGLDVFKLYRDGKPVTFASDRAQGFHSDDIRFPIDPNSASSAKDAVAVLKGIMKTNRKCPKVQ